MSAERDSAVIPLATSSSLPHSTVVIPPTASMTPSIMPSHVTSSSPAQSSHDDSHSILPTGIPIDPEKAGEAFREHRDGLLIAVTDPLVLANNVYSKRIISRATLNRVKVSTLSTDDMNEKLFDAIEARIRTYPPDFHILLAILGNDPSLRDFAKRIQDSYSEFLSIMF